MTYLVKNTNNELMRLTVVSGLPMMPDGFELIGLESEVNPNGLDVSICIVQDVELAAAYQVLVSPAVEAQAEVLAQDEILAEPEVLEQDEVLDADGNVVTPHVDHKDAVAHQDAVEYKAAVPAQDAVYETVPAVRGLRLSVDSDKAAAKTVAVTAALYSDALTKAKAFGDSLIIQFGSENMALGITQAGKTSSVRKAMSEVISCLTTGSLYDAMDEARLIPSGSKDATFLTDARLLSFVNKIEGFLGKPLSTEL